MDATPVPTVALLIEMNKSLMEVSTYEASYYLERNKDRRWVDSYLGISTINVTPAYV